MGEWEMIQLGSLAAPKNGAIAIGPFGSAMKAELYTATGVPVIRGTNISNTRAWKGDWVFISESFADGMPRCVVKTGELVFPHRGSVGEVAIIPSEEHKRYFLSSSLMKIKIDERKADPFFVYYYFRSTAGRAEILKFASQVGTPGIGQPLSSLKMFSVPLPPLPEQKAISSILGALDDKIELNRQMNETLESMARLFFKDWFVDFGPTRAKAEGLQPYLEPELWSLFPDALDDDDKPVGWRVTEIGDIALVVDCLHSKKPQRQDNGKPLLQLWNIRDDGLIDMNDSFLISEADYANWISRIEAQAGDCVITNVGRVGAVSQIPVGLTAALGRNMTGLRCKSDFPYPTFLIECLLSNAMREEILRRTDAGTILNALNVRSIPKLNFYLSTHDVANAFEETVRPLRLKMEINQKENDQLAQTRDLLLPKLMSGQIRLQEAEKIVEKVL